MVRVVHDGVLDVIGRQHRCNLHEDSQDRVCKTYPQFRSIWATKDGARGDVGSDDKIDFSPNGSLTKVRYAGGHLTGFDFVEQEALSNCQCDSFFFTGTFLLFELNTTASSHQCKHFSPSVKYENPLSNCSSGRTSFLDNSEKTKKNHSPSFQCRQEYYFWALALLTRECQIAYNEPIGNLSTRVLKL